MMTSSKLMSIDDISFDDVINTICDLGAKRKALNASDIVQ